jgi:hypothetical protein
VNVLIAETMPITGQYPHVLKVVQNPIRGKAKLLGASFLEYLKQFINSGGHSNFSEIKMAILRQLSLPAAHLRKPQN